MSARAVEVRVEGGRIVLVAPYNPQMPAQAKAIGGRFDGPSKAWTFDARDEGRVRELARSVYGTDGSIEQAVDLVSIRVSAEGAARDPELFVAGRRVAWRAYRDEPVRLAAGVVIVSGQFIGSGGSMRYPLIGDNDVLLEVRDIPRASAVTVPGAELIDNSDQAARLELLRGERDQLAARLAELDRLIAEASND
ncbi:MAG: hypothetical protein ABI140_06735 [Jatrophihabitantaceae bacterium]